MRKINVIGYACYDIVLYLAAILKELGESVTIADETEGSKLFDYLPNVQGMNGLGVTEFRGVRYVRSRMTISENETDYCIILRNSDQCIFEGECNLAVLRQESGYEWLYVTDEDIRHVTATECVFEGVRYFEKENGFSGAHVPIRLIRGYTGVMHELYDGMLKEGKTGLFTIPYIEKDRKAELYLSVRDDISFKPISERLSSIIEKMVYLLRPGTKVAEFERAYTLMMKGGTR